MVAQRPLTPFRNMDTFSLNPAMPVLLPPDPLSDDFSWTCGDDPHISHIAKIGIGASSEVHKIGSKGSDCPVPEVVHKGRTANDQIFARKVLKPFSMLARQDIFNEFQTIEQLCKQSSHENIVAVYRYDRLGDWYYIDMELCEFNLEQYIYDFDTADRTLPVLTMSTLLKIMQEVSRGLAFIHESRKVHRDIKPQNILYSIHGMWKIGDFGFTSDAASGLARSEARRGTSSYRAPELLRFSTFDDRVDIWALGCVFYELVCRKTAFKDDWQVTEYARQNMKMYVPLRRFVDVNARTPVVNLIHEMLQLRPSSRPSAADLCSLFDSIEGSFQGSADLPLFSRINTPSNQKLSRSVVFSVPPYGRNPYFSGRDDVLDTLCLELKATKPNRYNHRIALYGLGGIGKTQVALEYAYRHEEDYAFVFWVSGADRPQLLSGFCDIARTVGCVPSEKPEEVAVRVLQWLRDAEDWLLVIDNVDDTSVVDSYLPESRGGHTIITTRSPNSDALRAIGLEVPEMSRENSIKFLLLRLGITEPTEGVLREIGNIVDALGRLPLAIDHAAAYINHPGKIFEYLPDFRAHRQELLGLRLPYRSLYNHTVVTTWKMSFERLKKNSLDSAELLPYFSFMNPDEILVEFLREGATALAPNLQYLLRDRFKWKESLRSLEDSSLVRVSLDRDRIRIHRLVQAVTQDRFGSERTIIASTTVHMGLQAFPSLDSSLTELEKARRFRVQVVACLETTKGLCESSERLELAERLAEYLIWDGFYMDASRWSSSILEIRNREFGEAHEATLRSMHLLARAWRNNANTQKALTLLTTTLHLRQKVLGLEHADTLNTTHLLAVVYNDLGEFAKSCEIQEKLVDMRKRVLGHEHPDTLDSMHSLAVDYSCLNRHHEAAELDAKTLEMRRRVLGPEHPHTLDSMHNLAVDYSNLNRDDEAAELNTKTLETRKRVLGPEHPHTLDSMHSLAVDHSNLNRHNEAAALNAKLSEIQKRVLGSELTEAGNPMGSG